VRRHAYRTKSNKVDITKTPGGRLVCHYVKKRANGPRCGEYVLSLSLSLSLFDPPNHTHTQSNSCGGAIAGIPALRPKQYKNIAKNKRTVSRAYGGSRCASCVRDRIVRAFLIEEQKIVKQVLMEKMKKSKK